MRLTDLAGRVFPNDRLVYLVHLATLNVRYYNYALSISYRAYVCTAPYQTSLYTTPLRYSYTITTTVDYRTQICITGLALPLMLRYCLRFMHHSAA